MAFQRVNGVVLHYRVSGPSRAPVLVFVNSLGTDFRIWEKVAAAFADDFRVLLYDKRGHGLSDAPAAPYRLETHADDLLVLLQALRIDRFSMVGLSVGGMVAQYLAINVPDRLERLVLCDTAAKIGSADMWDARIEAIGAHGLDVMADAVLERWFTADFRANRPADLAGWRNMLTRIPAEGYAGTCAAIRHADLTESLPKISCPTLVLVGDQDLATPPDLVRATADRIPRSRFEIIAGSGHLPCIERPDALLSLIGTHVREAANV